MRAAAISASLVFLASAALALASGARLDTTVERALGGAVLTAFAVLAAVRAGSSIGRAEKAKAP